MTTARVERRSSFADWLTNRMQELDMSQRDVARAAGAVDGRMRITHSTVSRYASGQYDATRMGEDTLKALAKALRTPERVLREMAGLPVARGPYVPPPEAVYLDDAERKLLDQLIRRLARDNTPTKHSITQRTR